VPSPSWHRQFGLGKSGTPLLFRNLGSPILPVRSCTKDELSAFRRSLCNASTFLLGASVTPY
jgi:hypothetical protein